MSNQTRTIILAGISSGAIGVIVGVIVFFLSTSVFAEEAAAVKVDAVAVKKLARMDSSTSRYRYITAGGDRVKLAGGREDTLAFDKSTGVDRIRNRMNLILARQGISMPFRWLVPFQ